METSCSFFAFQPRCSPYWALNMPCLQSPQGLCTPYSFCSDSPSPKYPMAGPSTPFRSLINCHCSSEAFPERPVLNSIPALLTLLSLPRCSPRHLALRVLFLSFPTLHEQRLCLVHCVTRVG